MTRYERHNGLQKVKANDSKCLSGRGAEAVNESMTVPGKGRLKLPIGGVKQCEAPASCTFGKQHAKLPDHFLRSTAFPRRLATLRWNEHGWGYGVRTSDMGRIFRPLSCPYRFAHRWSRYRQWASKYIR